MGLPSNIKLLLFQLAGVAAGMRVYGYTATVGQAALSAAGAIPFSHMSELIDLLTAETT